MNFLKKTVQVASLFLLLLISVKVSASDKKTTSSSEIILFAAASLVEVLSEISDSFELAYGIKVKKNLASSGTLVRQIVQGEAPDVFISASKKWINYVDSLGYLQKGYSGEVARNELVIITPKDSRHNDIRIDSSLNFKLLVNSGKISMGDPAHVPAGKYAIEALEYYGWYEYVKSKILPGKDVRSALMVVEMGESPLGIVYKTDALKSGKVKIVGTFPESSHSPIVYVAGVCKDSDAGKKFFEYLNSGASKQLWLKYAFKK